MPKDDEAQVVIPAGSLPPEEENSVQDLPQAEPPSQGEMILGKFKSQDDLAKAYQELEREYGRSGQEIGGLRKQADMQTKQTELLLNQLASLMQGANTPPVQTGAPDLDQQIAALRGAVESGEMDIGQALAHTVGLTSKKAEMVAMDAVKRARAEEGASAAREKFLKENPDFYDVQKSGALQGIKNENPIHDDLSAYAEYKRREAIANLDTERKAAFEKGVAEAARLSQGAEAAGRVSGKTGSSVRTPTNNKPMSDYERGQGMIGVLTRLRGG